MIHRCRLCRERVLPGSMFCAKHHDEAERFARSFGPYGETVGPEEQTPTRAAPIDHPYPDLDTVLRPQLDSISLKGEYEHQSGPARWPQISLYYLDNRLLARTYFSILGESKEESDRSFVLSDPSVVSALAVDGTIFIELGKQLQAHDADLQSHEIQTLDIQLVTYAGLIAINRHTPGAKDQNLALFDRVGDQFEATTFSNEAKQRLQHDRWRTIEEADE